MRQIIGFLEDPTEVTLEIYKAIDTHSNMLQNTLQDIYSDLRELGDSVSTDWILQSQIRLSNQIERIQSQI